MLPAPLGENGQPSPTLHIDYGRRGVTFRERGVDGLENLTDDELVQTAFTLQAMGDNWQFWLADVLREKIKRSGKEEAYGLIGSRFKYTYLDNILWTAERVPPENQTFDVPFTYYQAVASAPPEEQRELLGTLWRDPNSGRLNMNRDEFREQVAEKRNDRYAREHGLTVPSDRSVVIENGTVDHEAFDADPEWIREDCVFCEGQGAIWKRQRQGEQ